MWHLHSLLKNLKIPATRHMLACIAEIGAPVWRGPSDFAPTDRGASEFETYLTTLDDPHLLFGFNISWLHMSSLNWN